MVVWRACAWSVRVTSLTTSSGTTKRIRRQFTEQIQSAFSHDPRRERLENTMDTIGIKPGNSGFIRCNGHKAYNCRLYRNIQQICLKPSNRGFIANIAYKAYNYRLR